MKNKISGKLKNAIICTALTVFTFASVLPAGAETFLPNFRIKEYSGNTAGERDSAIAVTGVGETDAETFLPNVQVNEDIGNVVSESEPAIAVADDGTIYTVWHKNGTDKNIMFSKSTDGGLTFSTDIKINDNEAVYPLNNGVYNSDIALDSNGNIYVVWHDYRSWVNDSSWESPVDVYLSKSIDGGLTWSSDLKIPNRNAIYYPWQFQPYIAIDQNNGNVYVSFTDYNSYYVSGIYDYGDISVVRSTDGGATFEPAVKVDDTGNTTTQLWSSIAVDSVSGNVYVVFEDLRNGDKDIYLAKSTDYGTTFEANVLVNDVITNDQNEPSVKVDSTGAVYVVWGDWKNDPAQTVEPYLNDIYIAKSTDDGVSFAASVRVTDEPMNGTYSYTFPPRLSIDDSGTVHIVWYDLRSGSSVCYYDKSSDGGLTFSTDSVVNDDAQEVAHALPKIATNGSEAYIVWIDKRNGDNTMYDIFFARSGIPTYTISGTINYYDGLKVVPDALVSFWASEGSHLVYGSTYTNENGYYEFTDLNQEGWDYHISVLKEDTSTGITGSDITAIAQHIVGIEYFTSIFQKISADVNEINLVTGSDITMIAQYIVGLITELDSGDWKFYSTEATPTEANYIIEGMERVINLTSDAADQDFTGVKMGDVNASWTSE